MAYADPQSVTINSVANSLPRVGAGPDSGNFKANDGNVVLTVKHSNGRRLRHTARLDFSKIAADPLISSTNIKYSMSAYVVVDAPVTGFTVAEQKQIVDALTAWLAAGAGAANSTTKLLGGEN
jgi:hypothetical protein